MGNSIHRGPVGEPVGVLFKRGLFERQMKEGSENGASLCMAPLTGILMGGGCPLLGTLKDM